ncbi:hypothetical protein WDV85_03020 [Pseudokineococcus sp. 5B2Z-1]|uniref:hypothetical protein n=1 Tax=Pseudokineococcus sp. 5B2Z-1 TaxID=3132744 RepID=UPI0030B22892
MTAVPQGEGAVRVVSGLDVDRRLEELGLERGVLVMALEAGQTSAQQATEHHPVTAAGILRWLATVETLRRELEVQLDWAPDDVRNSPRVLSPDRTTAVLVARGDRGTGEVEVTPQTARARGRSTVQAVNINEQMALPLDVRVVADPSAERTDGVQTWILLHYLSDEDPQQLRAELSLPVRVDETGHVTGWVERILLPPLTFGPDVGSARDAGDDGEGDGDVEVRVGRR